MPYFHSSRAELPIGTVIAPYGLQSRIPNAWALLNDETAAGPIRAIRALKAIVREWQSPHRGSSFIEVVAERVRAAQFDGLPSRMDCSFAMPTVEAALAHSQQFQHGQHFFQVEPIGTPRIWFADMESLAQGPNLDGDPQREYQALVDRVAAYWLGFSQDRGQVRVRTEILIEGAIRVVGPCLAPNPVARR